MKKSLADKIEQYLKVLIDRSENQVIEIQRAELAETFNCVPSQVTYVLGTRFTEKNGYFTESRRGGKGYVRITRYTNTNVSPAICRKELLLFIEEMTDNQKLTLRESEMLKHIILNALGEIPVQHKVQVFRAIRFALKDLMQ